MKTTTNTVNTVTQVSSYTPLTDTQKLERIGQRPTLTDPVVKYTGPDPAGYYNDLTREAGHITETIAGIQEARGVEHALTSTRTALDRYDFMVEVYRDAPPATRAGNAETMLLLEAIGTISIAVEKTTYLLTEERIRAGLPAPSSQVYGSPVVMEGHTFINDETRKHHSRRLLRKVGEYAKEAEGHLARGDAESAGYSIMTVARYAEAIVRNYLFYPPAMRAEEGSMSDLVITLFYFLPVVEGWGNVRAEAEAEVGVEVEVEVEEVVAV